MKEKIKILELIDEIVTLKSDNKCSTCCIDKDCKICKPDFIAEEKRNMYNYFFDGGEEEVRRIMMTL